MLAGLLAASGPIEARYITRFALGDLRLGAGDATILEALSKMSTGDRNFKEELEGAYNICCDLGTIGEVLAKQGVKGIEEFRVTLFQADRGLRSPSAFRPRNRNTGSDGPGKCAVESKYDGLRVQIHMDRKAKRIEIFSRRLERITDMFPDLVKAAFAELKGDKVILEGEG